MKLLLLLLLTIVKPADAVGSLDSVLDSFVPLDNLLDGLLPNPGQLSVNSAGSCDVDSDDDGKALGQPGTFQARIGELGAPICGEALGDGLCPCTTARRILPSRWRSLTPRLVC